MSLFSELKAALPDRQEELPGLILKLRLLAVNLRSDVLEKWISYESNGYPRKVTVPPYRKTTITYRGNFRAPDGSMIDDVQIPGAIIAEQAGRHWLQYEIRQGVPAVSELLKGGEGESGAFFIEVPDLITALDGKAFEGCRCCAVRGSISRGCFADIDHSVRGKILEFLIRLERDYPDIAEISCGTGPGLGYTLQDVSGITGQVVYGNVTTVSVSGPGTVVNVAVVPHDLPSLVAGFRNIGLPESDVAELADAVASGTSEEGGWLNSKAAEWLSERLKKLGTGLWDGGISVVTKVLSELISQYYGLGK
jgi:hypothetical protein